MSRKRKMILLMIGLVAAAATVFLVPTLFFRPWRIGHFFLRADLLYLLRRPTLLSRLHVLEPYGIRFHADDWDDMSVEFAAADLERDRRNLATLRAYDREGLSADDRASYDVLDWLLTSRLEGERFLYHDYPVNQTAGMQSELPDFLLNHHPFDDLTSAREYLTRMEKIAPAMDELLRSLRFREERGILPPRFVFDRVIKEMREFSAKPPADHDLTLHLGMKLDELGVDSQRKTELLAEAQTILKHNVYPAYGRLIEYHASTRAKASEDDGVWKLPEGEAFYRYALKSQTTTELSPDEIHAIGLKEVAALQAEIREILTKRGFWRGAVGPSLRAAGEDPAFLYSDDDVGRARILTDYQTIIDEVDRGMDRLFDLRPETGVVVKRIPPFKEQGGPGGYYTPPPLDGSRPGTFFANLRDVRSIARFGMRTLAYHEAIPGHHFQITIAMHLDLPIFRRFPWFTAYIEGWALYAERLAAENGYMEGPMDRVGYLSSELFRAARLVVDTGIHHKRWNRARAVAYMLENTGSSEIEANSEIERYVVWPGQACAYKIGQLKILELRERARRKLGERFELKQFHNAILSGGALPLELLGRRVDEYIERTLVPR